MRCEQVLPYIPGHAGGDLRADTSRAVAAHIAECETCKAEAARAGRVIGGLALLQEREVEPPAFLVDAILERTVQQPARRLVPVLPIAAGDIPRLLAEHRETIASVAGATVVAAGAAYALWRAVRSIRSAQPATS